MLHSWTTFANDTSCCWMMPHLFCFFTMNTHYYWHLLYICTVYTRRIIWEFSLFTLALALHKANVRTARSLSRRETIQSNSQLLVNAVCYGQWRKTVMLQLAQSARVGTKQLTADLIYIRRQLNASDTDIDDVSTGISDVMATVTRLVTSAQAVQDNITMTSSHAANLSDATLNVTQLEVDATSVESQVCSHSSAVMLPLKSSSFRWSSYQSQFHLH